MKHKTIILSLAIVLGAAFLLGVMPARASSGPAQGSIFTPTAQPDGRILYIVQENDTCISIALRYLGGDTNKLISLNGLDQNCTIYPGQELLLGTYETPVPSAGPSPTATPIVPTPTPYNGNGAICVYLYNDVNGNAMLDTDEGPIAGGAISVADRQGLVSLDGKTLGDGTQVCFQNIPEGEYNISVGPPEGYNATTTMNYPLTLKAGDSSILNFGAQISLAAIPPEDLPPSEGGRSPVLAIVGGLMILLGIGLGIYFVFLQSKK